jgi:uncharacterized membrane protein
MPGELVELVAQIIEGLAVLVIVAGIGYGFSCLFFPKQHRGADAFIRFKHRVGKSLLLGLEFLVAADIVRTVAISPTVQSMVLLGMLVLIRTFLSWSLVVEIEGRWPWQKRESPGTSSGQDGYATGESILRGE